ncbi:MAG: hypothetical protein ACPL0A_01420, partial [Candidatus Micrarchaeia archaeon]
MGNSRYAPKEIIEHINAGKLTPEEKRLVADAFEEKYERNLIIVNSILSLIKISGDEKVASNIKGIVSKSMERVKKGDRPLSNDDIKKLHTALTALDARELTADLVED